MSTPNPIAAMIARSMPWLWASVAPTREPPVAKVPELGKDAVPPPADPCETPEIPVLQAIEPAARPPDCRQGAAPAGAEPIGKPGTIGRPCGWQRRSWDGFASTAWPAN